ncbi:MAG: o-succinylbenzoate synthase [Muribaculaceae bacterium]|nr:o-succinylbenzoate synthase [Muribaculaceae bacterium]
MSRYHIDINTRVFHFKEPAGTSRGIYRTRASRFVLLTCDDLPGIVGVGECAPLPNLSCDDLPDYDAVLRRQCDEVCARGGIDVDALRDFPSMLFGLETAWRQLHLGGSTALSVTPFARGEEGIPINGLVWMGDFDTMAARLEQKLAQGFSCVKIKIGAIDFADEMALIHRLRERYGSDRIELRVDVNGAFSPDEALEKLNKLAAYDIHSIEQPIMAGQWQEMARLCKMSPLPIALDEELIGINTVERKRQLLDTICPQYIILKPSLHGGMAGCREWINLARERGIGSWITSALESNVGLNAIAHLAAEVYGPSITMPQGLGTGQLFTDNIDTVPIAIRGDKLWYKP